MVDIACNKILLLLQVGQYTFAARRNSCHVPSNTIVTVFSSSKRNSVQAQKMDVAKKELEKLRPRPGFWKRDTFFAMQKMCRTQSRQELQVKAMQIIQG